MASKEGQEIRQRNKGSSGEKTEPDRVQPVPSDDADSIGTSTVPTKPRKKKTSAIIWYVDGLGLY